MRNFEAKNYTFINNIKEIVRLRFQGNAAELCRRAGIPRTTLQSCLEGCVPSSEILKRLAATIDVNMGDLYCIDIHKLPRKVLKREEFERQRPKKYRQYD